MVEEKDVHTQHALEVIKVVASVLPMVEVKDVQSNPARILLNQEDYAKVMEVRNIMLKLSIIYNTRLVQLTG